MNEPEQMHNEEPEETLDDRPQRFMRYAKARDKCLFGGIMTLACGLSWIGEYDPDTGTVLIIPTLLGCAGLMILLIFMVYSHFVWNDNELVHHHVCVALACMVLFDAVGLTFMLNGFSHPYMVYGMLAAAAGLDEILISVWMHRECIRIRKEIIAEFVETL